MDNSDTALTANGGLSCEIQEDISGLRRSKRQRVTSFFSPDFVTAFIVDDLGQIDEQVVYALLVDEKPGTYKEAMSSIDATFWKEAI